MVKIELDIGQYNRLAYNSVNYACGRSSYIVSVVLGIVRGNIEYLDHSTIDRTVRLIVDRDYGESDIVDSYHSDDWRMLARDLLDQRVIGLPSSGKIRFRDPDDLRLLIITSFRSNLYYPDNGVVPDYMKVLIECSGYLNKDWYRVFKDDIDEAMYYGVDLGPYNELVGYIYRSEKDSLPSPMTKS